MPKYYNNDGTFSISPSRLGLRGFLSGQKTKQSSKALAGFSFPAYNGMQLQE